MRTFRRRGSRRLNLATSEDLAVFIGGKRQSVVGNLSFFEQHHGNFVANRIDAFADVAFQTRTVVKKVNGLFAYDADENVEKVLGNRHRCGLHWKDKLYQSVGTGPNGGIRV